ncbi:MAG TPA: hypothetical protein VGC39_08715, partial [Candidatus Methylacidiphilales bacterium]
METTIIDQRYSLLAELGSGGEAWVYRAIDLTTGGEVVVRIPSTPVASPQTMPAPSEIRHERWVELLGAGIDAQF